MKPSFFGLTGFLLIAACSPCRDLDCIANQELAVRFVSAADGSSLVSGQDPVLSEVNIYCYKESGSGPEQVAVSIHGDKVYSNLDYTSEVYYYEALGKTDTVEMTYAERVTECCGTVHTIETLILNGRPIDDVDPGVVEITLRR